jgi:hypothetical protein
MVVPSNSHRRAARRWASSSLRRCPTILTPRSFKSSAVKLGRTASSISFSRNAASYCPRPRLRSQSPRSMVALELRPTSMIMQAKQPVQTTLFESAFSPDGPRMSELGQTEKNHAVSAGPRTARKRTCFEQSVSSHFDLKRSSHNWRLSFGKMAVAGLLLVPTPCRVLDALN